VAKVGSLLIDLGMNTAKFDSGIKRSTSSISKFRKRATKDFAMIRRSANSLGGGLGRITGAIAAIVGPAALVALTKQALAASDAMGKLSDDLGITTHRLSGFQIAAQIGGASAEDMNKAFVKLAVNVGDAAAGTGEASDAFKRMGLDARNLVGMSLDEQMIAVAEGLKNVGSEAKQVQTVYEVFGKSGAKLLTTLKGGRKELEKWANWSEKVGVSLNRMDIRKLEAANDAMFIAQESTKGLGNSLALAFAPILKGLSDQFVLIAENSQGFRSQMTDLVDSSVTLFGGLLNGFRGLNIALMKAKEGWYIIGAVIVQIFDESKFVFAQFTHWAEKQWTGFIYTLRNLLGNFLEGFLSVIKEINAPFSAFVANLANIWGKFIAVIQTKFADFVSVVAEGLKKANVRGVFDDAIVSTEAFAAALKKAGETPATFDADKFKIGTEALDQAELFLQSMRKVNAEDLKKMDGMKAPEMENSAAKGFLMGLAEQTKNEINELVAQGLPSQAIKEWVEKQREELAKLAAEIQEGAAAAVPAIKTMGAALLESIEEVGTKFDNVFLAWEEGMDGMKKVFLNNIKKMLSDQLMKQLASLFDIIPFGGGAGGIFKKLLGFANGGSFEVGGTGGTDSNVVAFRATKGEQVTVQTPNQASGGGGGGVVFQNSYDFRGSTLSEAQVAAMIEQSNGVMQRQIQNKMIRGRF
jgi:hypothetical protein